MNKETISNDIALLHDAGNDPWPDARPNRRKAGGHRKSRGGGKGFKRLRNGLCVRNFVLKMELTTDKGGKVSTLELDQAYPRFPWARVALTDEEKTFPKACWSAVSPDVPDAGEEMAFSKYISFNGKSLKEQRASG